jgi:predicted deacylase
MDVIDYFSPDYRTARQKFLAAASDAGAPVTSFENPAPGPDGDPVFTDVTVLGEGSGGKVYLATAGTHGVEGFCGSGAMVGWLRSGQLSDLPADVKVVLVHAINPHGFAWLRRVTEDNVDLNRNFQNFAESLPQTPGYDSLHSALVPDAWDEESRAAAKDTAERFVGEHGMEAFQRAISCGQYSHSDGLFYGGNRPTWSNDTFREVVRRHVEGADAVVFQDYHTGLGPYGTADLICDAKSGTDYAARMQQIYGEGLSSPAMGNSTSAPLNGTIRKALKEMLPDAELTGITVEYGTYPLLTVLEALRADNWLYARGDQDSPLGRQIKADIRQAFYPDEDDWKELVYLRSRQILRRGITALSG